MLNTKMKVFSDEFQIFKRLIFRFHLHFPGCRSSELKLQSAMMIKFWEGQNEVKIPKKTQTPKFNSEFTPAK